MAIGIEKCLAYSVAYLEARLQNPRQGNDYVSRRCKDLIRPPAERYLPVRSVCARRWDLKIVVARMVDINSRYAFFIRVETAAIEQEVHALQNGDHLDLYNRRNNHQVDRGAGGAKLFGAPVLKFDAVLTGQQITFDANR